MKRVTSIPDELWQGLRIPFIPAAELAEGGQEFGLIDFSTRRNRRFESREEAVYTIVLLESGELRTLTLALSPLRQRLGELARRYKRDGGLGPFVLVKSEGEGDEFSYQFAERDGEGKPVPLQVPEEGAVP